MGQTDRQMDEQTDTRPTCVHFPLNAASIISHTTVKTRSHPEMVGDMLRVTLNSDLSKIPFVHF